MQYTKETYMKRHLLVAGTIAFRLALVLAMPGCGRSQTPETTTPAAPPVVKSEPTPGMIVYNARSGSKMRIEGTANIIHTTWQIEGPIIMGSMEVGPAFPMEAGQAVTPGKVAAKAEVSIPVRSLKSVNEDGTHYSDRMDEVMCEHLKEAQHKKIFYQLTEMTLKEAPKAKDAPYVFEAKGLLAVSGVTNNNTMTVNVMPVLYKTDKVTEKRLEVTGTTTVKMTDFKDEIVDISILGLGHIRTGDEVKLVFKWVLGQKRPVAAP
jgi:hypothetical protein